jgi:hypothetical protein
MESTTTPKTRWHRLLGTLLEKLLSPVGVTVSTEAPIMSTSPKTDILLLKRTPGPWTELQRSRLPDGIRDSQANVILLEFKYTESLDADALRQTLCYDYFYQQTQHLEYPEIQTVLLLAIQPQAETLAKFAYEATAQAGVYRNSQWLLNTIPILSLNELPNEPQNAWVKCFASHRKEKLKAFRLLRQLDWRVLTVDLEWFLAGLWRYWFISTGENMIPEAFELTPEQVTEMGKVWGSIHLSKLSLEERLAGVSTAELLGRLKPEERLVGLKPEERLVGLKPEDVLGYFKSEDLLNYFKPEERLRGLSLTEMEALETYIQQVKQTHTAPPQHSPPK